MPLPIASDPASDAAAAPSSASTTAHISFSSSFRPIRHLLPTARSASIGTRPASAPSGSFSRTRALASALASVARFESMERAEEANEDWNRNVMWSEDDEAMDRETMARMLSGASARRAALRESMRSDARSFEDDDLAEDKTTTAGSSSSSSSTPAPSSTPRHAASHASDPSSATSPSSFLRVGSIFEGVQVFTNRPRQPSSRNANTSSSSNGNSNSSTSARAVSAAVGLLRRSSVIRRRPTAANPTPYSLPAPASTTALTGPSSATAFVSDAAVELSPSATATTERMEQLSSFVDMLPTLSSNLLERLSVATSVAIDSHSSSSAPSIGPDLATDFGRALAIVAATRASLPDAAAASPAPMDRIEERSTARADGTRILASASTVHASRLETIARARAILAATSRNFDLMDSYARAEAAQFRHILPPLSQSEVLQVTRMALDEEEVDATQEAELMEHVERDGDESWKVKIWITSVDERMRSIGGYMSAFGVPTCATSPGSSPQPGEKTVVTTYFVGEIIDPSLPAGLWTSTTSSSKIDDEANWTKLAPFIGVGREEMYEGLRDPEWLADKCRGYTLMRWKEIDFVDVEPTESTLSIAGYYYMSMERQTGYLEGLYFDQASTPFQRLILSPGNSFQTEVYSAC